MVDEIRSRPMPHADFPHEEKVTGMRPGDAVRKLFDKQLDGKRLVGEWWGESPEETDAAIDRDRVAFEQLAFADGKKTDSDRKETETGSEAESENKNAGAGIAAAPNPFQLLGQLSTTRTAGTVQSAARPDFSRHELAARVVEAAEALAVRVDAGQSESELKIEFKEELLPETSAVIRREVQGGKLTVEFTTENQSVNLFLSNSNASLRQQLVERFGCEVVVTVDYRPRDQRDQRDGEADERGRQRGQQWEMEG